MSFQNCLKVADFFAFSLQVKLFILMGASARTAGQGSRGRLLWVPPRPCRRAHSIPWPGPAEWGCLVRTHPAGKMRPKEGLWCTNSSMPGSRLRRALPAAPPPACGVHGAGLGLSPTSFRLRASPCQLPPAGTRALQAPSLLAAYPAMFVRQAGCASGLESGGFPRACGRV